MVYNRIARESDFVELRRRYRSFAFPATIAFMAWYILYIVCNNWARDFIDWFPLRNPELISIPFGFLCGIVGALISKEIHSAARYDEPSVRALTGAGAEKAVVH